MKKKLEKGQQRRWCVQSLKHVITRPNQNSTLILTDANEVVLQASAHVFCRPVLPAFFNEVGQKLEVMQRRNQATLAVPEIENKQEGTIG